MNFGTKGCMYNCGDECTGECIKVETKTKKMSEEKDLEYYRKNAEEDYTTTPISVLRYISELECGINQNKYDE